MAKKVTSVSWQGSNIPVGITLTAGTGTFIGTPTVEGQSSVDVEVTTNYGKAEGSIQVNVLSTQFAPFIASNQTITLYESSVSTERHFLSGINVHRNTGTPVITSDLNVAVKLGETLTYQITTLFDDPTEQPQSYYLSSGPTGAAVDAETGEVTWQVPSSWDVNNTPVSLVVGVRNSFGSTTQQVLVSIIRPFFYYPVITSPSTTVNVTLGDTFTYPVTMAYDDPQGYTYSITSNPAGAVFDENTKVVTWKIAQKYFNPSTQYSLTVTATNTYGKSDSKTIPLVVVVPESFKPVIDDDQTITMDEGLTVDYTIAGTNTTVNAGPPVIVSPSAVTADVGSTLSYQITTSFVDDEKQVYLLSNAPDTASLDPVTGIVTMPIPKTATVGSRVSMTVGIENSYATATKTLTVTYTAPANYVPVITNEDTTLALIGNNFSYQVTTAVADPERMVYEVTGTENIPEGLELTFNRSTGVLSGYIPDEGLDFKQTFNLTFSVENSYYQSAQKVVTIGFNVPDSYKPHIADNQEIEAYEAEEMTAYSVQADNV